jgi:hypothetical protein
LSLASEKLVSKFAFNFHLCRYRVVHVRRLQFPGVVAASPLAKMDTTVGLYKLNPVVTDSA